MAKGKKKNVEKEIPPDIKKRGRGRPPKHEMDDMEKVEEKSRKRGRKGKGE